MNSNKIKISPIESPACKKCVCVCVFTTFVKSKKTRRKFNSKKSKECFLQALLHSFVNRYWSFSFFNCVVMVILFRKKKRKRKRKTKQQQRRREKKIFECI